PPRPTLFPYTTLFRSLQPAAHAPLVPEERDGLVHRQVEDLGHVLPLVADLQDVLLEAGAVARLALEVEVGEELHLHLHDALALRSEEHTSELQSRENL